jgi:hypothetical protein
VSQADTNRNTNMVDLWPGSTPVRRPARPPRGAHHHHHTKSTTPTQPPRRPARTEGAGRHDTASSANRTRGIPPISRSHGAASAATVMPRLVMVHVKPSTEELSKNPHSIKLVVSKLPPPESQPVGCSVGCFELAMPVARRNTARPLATTRSRDTAMPRHEGDGRKRYRTVD